MRKIIYQNSLDQSFTEYFSKDTDLLEFAKKLVKSGMKNVIIEDNGVRISVR